ncbi:MAG: hypothetical protein M1828_005955 [Chrysothrix sp. TS-e1954]|nr:MAG: hypothetical protein M1828_005955 [Chrysothrix sp. TS-e1954]
MSLAAISIPVILETSTESSISLLRPWTRLYHYGHIYMPVIAVTATSLYAYTAWSKRAAGIKQWRKYAFAGATTISMVPFTWLIMDGTNTTLFQLEASASASASNFPDPVKLGKVQALVVKWAWLHAVRSMFPLVGAIIGFRGVLQELGV